MLKFFGCAYVKTVSDITNGGFYKREWDGEPFKSFKGEWEQLVDILKESLLIEWSKFSGPYDQPSMFGAPR